MRKGTLTVKLRFRVLPEGLSGKSVAGEPVFPSAIPEGSSFEVDISPICDTRKAEVKYGLVSSSLESVTDTAKVYIPASMDAYNVAFKRKLVQSIIYCATERERVWATIDYGDTRLFTGIVDLSNLSIQSYSYQGDIELTLKDNGYLLEEKIARSIELPVQSFPNFNEKSSPKVKGVYYKDTGNANAFYFWNGSAWAHKESFSDTESKFFHPDATVRVWSSAVVGGELVESVVGALLGMAGYSVSGGTIDPSASDTSTSVVRCFTYDMSEDKTYKEVLDTLLKEYRMCLTFTPEGKVRIVSLSHASIHATRDIGYGLKGPLGRRDGIKTTFEASKKDGVKLKYSSGLAVRREQSIYSENLGSEFDKNGELKGTAIKPQQCLPETGDITATYQEFNAKFLDRAYTTKVNRKENEDLSIISTHGHHLEVAQKGGTLAYPAFTVGESAENGTGANPYFMPKKAQVLFRNDYEMKNKDPDSTEYEEEAESHSIYLQIFNIVADVLYRDKTTTIYAPSATANPETYESTYLFDDGPARTFANFYLGWNQYGAMKTDWTEYKGTVDTIGSIIGYQHTDSAISSYCLLSEETISFTGSPDVPFVIKMHGIGIAPFNEKPVQSVSYMGDNKNRGENGATGNGIKSVTVTYGVSASASTQPTSWSPTIPAVAENQFLWTRTITDYTDDSVADTVTYTYALQGKTGASGASGTSVTVSSIQYQAGTSATTAPTGTWSNNPVSVAQGQYLWTKTTFSDGKVAYGVARQGTDGKPGATGATGRGISGITEYYLASASSTAPSASDTGWSTSAQTPTTAKPYLWNKTVVTYTSGSPTTTIAMIGQSITSRNEVKIQWTVWPDADIPPVENGTFLINGRLIAVSGMPINNALAESRWTDTYPADVPEGWYVWQRIRTTQSSDWAYTISTGRKLLELTATATQWHYNNRGAIIPYQSITLTARATGFSPPEYAWNINGQAMNETGNILKLADGTVGVVSVSACGFVASIELTNIQDTILPSAYLGIQDSLPETVPATVITENGTAPITTADAGQAIIKGDQVVLRSLNNDGTYSYVPYVYYNGAWQSAEDVPLQYSLALTNTISDVLTVANAKDSIQAYNVFTNLLVSKTAITDQLAAAKAFIKNLKVGSGTGIAGSGFRFRAMQDMDETGKPLSEPVFDISYGDKQLFKVNVDSGEICFGSSFLYQPQSDSIRTKDGKTVIRADGVLEAQSLVTHNAILDGYLVTNDVPFQIACAGNFGAKNGNLTLISKKNISNITRDDKGVFTVRLSSAPWLLCHPLSGYNYIDVQIIGNSHDSFENGFQNVQILTNNWVRNYIDGRLPTKTINGSLYAQLTYMTVYCCDNNNDAYYDPTECQFMVFITETKVFQ